MAYKLRKLHECPKKVQNVRKMSEIQNANFTLPESWRWVRLGEVCSIYPGQHILESDYNCGRVGVGYLTGPADFGETYPSVTKWTERPKAWCEPGDVLVTVKGAGVGKSNLAPNEQVAIGRQLMAIRPKPELMEQRFLYYVVIIHFSKLQAKSVGSTVPGLGRKDIETLEISLPPFHEQKRIAAKIQELMQEVERARTACEKQLEAAKALPAAYLQEVFESEEAKKWERKRTEEIISFIKNGIVAEQNFEGKGFKVTRIETISNGLRDQSKLGWVNKSAESFADFKLDKRDILFSHINSVERLGNCAIYEGIPENLYHGRGDLISRWFSVSRT